MTKIHSSIRLYSPQETEEGALPFHWAVGVLLSFSMFLGFGGCIVGLLSLPVIGWILALSGLAVIAAIELLADKPRELLAAFAGAVGVSLLTWAIAYRYTRAGLEIISNAVTRLLSIRNLQILAQYDVALPEGSHALAVTLFLLPLALLLALLCTLAVRSGLAAVPFGMLLFLLGIMLGLDCFLGAGWLLLLFLTLCGMLCRFNSPRGGTAALALPMAGLLAALALAVFALPNVSGQVSEYFSERHDALLRRLHVSQYEPTDLPLPEGRLAEAVCFAPGEETALLVAAREPSAMYLRGFVGGALNSGSWVPLSGEDLYREQSLFYRLHQNGFYPQTQLSQLALAVDYRTAEDAFEIAVKIENACGAFAYAPYEAVGVSSGLLPKDGLSDAALSGGLAQTYTLTAFPGLVFEYPTLESMLAAQSAAPGEALSSYLSSEERYRRFVYDAYTGLDKELCRVFAGHLSQGAVAGETHLSYADAKDAIRALLSQTMTYSAEAATPFDGSAASLERLLDGGQGFSSQYATVAALVFRYYGIPSRYAEGYLLTSSAAKSVQPGETLSVTMKESHAWVEYYHDGVGWIPFETTPGYLEEVETPVDMEEIDSPADPLPQPEDPAEETEDPKEPEEDKKPISPLLIGLLLLLLLVAGWFWARYLVLQRRREEFLQSDTNRAAAAVMRHLMRVLSSLGLSSSAAVPRLYDGIGSRLPRRRACRTVPPRRGNCRKSRFLGRCAPRA